jgi:hypothetical protein
VGHPNLSFVKGIDNTSSVNYTQVPTCELTLKECAGLGNEVMKQGRWNR